MNEMLNTNNSSDKQKPTPNQKLRRERDRRMWSQQELADKVGTTPLNIGRWERGVTQPGPFFRQKLCEVFEKSAYELGLISSRDNDTSIVEQAQSTPTTTSSSTHTPAPTYWNVPYRRNLFFTGREDILMQLRDAFISETSTIALAQPQAISGLGGIGKTQTAIEYAYRYRDSYQGIFWVRAESPDLLTSDYVTLAALLTLPERNEQDQSQIATAVIRWFDTHDSWLLILDNADELDAISEYIPSAGNGHILLTTRAQAVGTLAQRIDIDKLSLDDAVTLLLRRIKRLRGNTALESVPVTLRAQAQAIVEAVDCLPLALDQAGAYIEETSCSLSDYLKFYKTRRTKLLRMRGHDVGGHPEPVAATWSLAFENVERANHAAADLLRLCAFLHPDAIPETMIIEGASELGAVLQPVAEDELDLNEAISQLLRYSLVKRDAEENVLNIHRLVQAVVRDGMKEDEERMWAQRIVHMLDSVFPDPEHAETWPTCQRYLPHAQACTRLIEQDHIVVPASARLLYQTGQYLYERGRYLEVESFLTKAMQQHEQLYGEDHLDTANSINRLARHLMHECKFDEAIALFQRALTIREKYLGPEHVDIAQTLNYLGELYNVQGNNVESEQLYQRALTMRINVLGPEHPLVAQSLNNLSWLYVDLARFAEAEPLTQQALAICEKAYGPSHPDVAYSLNCMAWLYFTQKDYAKTAPLLERALSISQKLHGLEHPDVATEMCNLARVYQENKRYSEAEAMYVQALQIQERLIGRIHPDVAQILFNLGQLYYYQGQYEKVEPFYLEAIAIAEQKMGHVHAYVARYLSGLGLLYTAIERYQQAQQTLDKALAMREQLLGRDHPDVATTLENYVILLRKMHRDAEADELEARAQSIRAKQS